MADPAATMWVSFSLERSYLLQNAVQDGLCLFTHLPGLSANVHEMHILRVSAPPSALKKNSS